MTAEKNVSFLLSLMLLLHTHPHSSIHPLHCLLLIPCLQANLVDKLQRNIFESNNDGNNPYSPFNEGQFSLPRGIANAATDVHGQIVGQYLDQVFDYVDYGNNNGIIFYDDCDPNNEIKNKASAPYSSRTLDICEGDCSTGGSCPTCGSRCAENLKCFLRGSNGPRPPGCGRGEMEGSFDYCYNPFCDADNNLNQFTFSDELKQLFIDAWKIKEYEECIDADTELQLVANPGDDDKELADAAERAGTYPLGNCLGDCDE